MGELQKRIADSLSVFRSCLSEGCGVDDENLEKNIRRAVEEMRQEFPKRYSVACAPHWGDEEQYEREDFADEVVEWFKKYVSIKDRDRVYWEHGYI